MTRAGRGQAPCQDSCCSQVWARWGRKPSPALVSDAAVPPARRPARAELPVPPWGGISSQLVASPSPSPPPPRAWGEEQSPRFILGLLEPRGALSHCPQCRASACAARSLGSRRFVPQRCPCRDAGMRRGPSAALAGVHRGGNAVGASVLKLPPLSSSCRPGALGVFSVFWMHTVLKAER